MERGGRGGGETTTITRRNFGDNRFPEINLLYVPCRERGCPTRSVVQLHHFICTRYSHTRTRAHVHAGRNASFIAVTRFYLFLPFSDQPQGAPLVNFNIYIYIS